MHSQKSEVRDEQDVRQLEQHTAKPRNEVPAAGARTSARRGSTASDHQICAVGNLAQNAACSYPSVEGLLIEFCEVSDFADAVGASILGNEGIPKPVTGWTRFPSTAAVPSLGVLTAERLQRHRNRKPALIRIKTILPPTVRPHLVHKLLEVYELRKVSFLT